MDDELDELERQDLEDNDPRAWERDEEEGIGSLWIACYEGREPVLDEDPEVRREVEA